MPQPAHALEARVVRTTTVAIFLKNIFTLLFFQLNTLNITSDELYTQVLHTIAINYNTVYINI